MLIMLKNNQRNYGWVSIGFHWLSFVVIMFLFGLGLWMSDLDYYHAWYIRAPFIHKSVGVLFFLLVFLRIFWRAFNIRPSFEISVSFAERFLALSAQYIFYVLMLLIPVSGFLMATSKGNPVDVFGWFEVPVIVLVDNTKDRWSDIHEVLAWSLMVLVVLHVVAALKHHFKNKDQTLLKILGWAKSKGEKND
jgi:cytochrome b561